MFKLLYKDFILIKVHLFNVHKKDIIHLIYNNNPSKHNVNKEVCDKVIYLHNIFNKTYYILILNRIKEFNFLNSIIENSFIFQIHLMSIY